MSQVKKKSASKLKNVFQEALEANLVDLCQYLFIRCIQQPMASAVLLVDCFAVI